MTEFSPRPRTNTGWPVESCPEAITIGSGSPVRLTEAASSLPGMVAAWTVAPLPSSWAASLPTAAVERAASEDTITTPARSSSSPAPEANTPVGPIQLA